MRLTEFQKKAIIHSVERIFSKEKIPLLGTSLYLFGSRTKDDLKGGDIDLLLRAPPPLIKSLKKLKIDLSLEIQKNIGEQKIDLLIISVDPPLQPFHRIAIKQAQILMQW